MDYLYQNYVANVFKKIIIIWTTRGGGVRNTSHLPFDLPDESFVLIAKYAARDTRGIFSLNICTSTWSLILLLFSSWIRYFKLQTLYLKEKFWLHHSFMVTLQIIGAKNFAIYTKIFTSSLEFRRHFVKEARSLFSSTIRKKLHSDFNIRLAFFLIQF